MTKMFLKQLTKSFKTVFDKDNKKKIEFGVKKKDNKQ